MRSIRWSDSDKNLGPFTYAKDGYAALGVALGSGDGEGYHGCKLRLHLAGRTLIVHLPQWVLRPTARKVFPKWDADTVKRLGRDWYYQFTEREYGFTASTTEMHIFRGARTMDSSTDRAKVWFYPWREYRHIRHSAYDLEGKHFADFPTRYDYDETRAVEARCPAAKFLFADFDGEEITATCRIVEREWALGVRSFKWLSMIVPNKMERSLDIHFSAETGRRKGSWKGGTIGHGIKMLPGELHEAAFKRYCLEHEMKFIGKA